MTLRVWRSAAVAATLWSAVACGGAQSADRPASIDAAAKRAMPSPPDESEPDDGAKARRCDDLPEVKLRPPKADPIDAPVLADDAGSGRKIVARWYDARIFAQPDVASMVIGYARRGQKVAVRKGVTGQGCPADMWYELVGGGFACAAREFREDTVQISDPVPIQDAALPYGYAKLTQDEALRYERLPTAEELEALEQGRAPSELVSGRMQGAYFATVVESVEHLGARWHRGDDGKWVRDIDVDLIEPHGHRGEALQGADDLPLAFVHVPTAEVHCRCDGHWMPCGEASRMTRFAVAGQVERGGETFVETADGHAVPSSDVRVIELAARPPEVGTDERWIRVDLSEQSLVAYEGDRPVYATIVSTGKGDHATPTGVWKVDRKYVSTTMSGPDEDKGTYTVSEVPWTMFYDGDFALHGAYWHEEFGKVRSHGCTNIPPIDARWLFGWAGGVPAGWHGASHHEGPWVVIAQ